MARLPAREQILNSETPVPAPRPARGVLLHKGEVMLVAGQAHRPNKPTETGRRETPADSNRSSEGKLMRSRNNGQVSGRSSSLIKPLCGKGVRRGLQGKTGARSRCAVFFPRRPAPRECHCPAPARAAADGAVCMQPQGVPRVKPPGVPFLLKILVIERFSLGFFQNHLNKEAHSHPFVCVWVHSADSYNTTRAINSQTTEVLGSLGHVNPSIMIRL